jgi:glycosyltransferase involved in cell wall biosynthesis
MRIVIAHNRYKYAGGEDSVMLAEAEMLRSSGHDIELFEVDNKIIEGTKAKIVAATSLFGSQRSYQNMTALLTKFRPDILHIHNWFPLLSPSVISAASQLDIPVVQTLHNFRMLCANAILYRNGKLCQDCLGKVFPLGGALNGCYSASRIGSAIVSTAFSYHRLAHTWDSISTFIALSEFQRRLLVRGGIDPAQIVVKPNFVKDTGDVGDGSGGYALFVGRLTLEKGIRTVLKAWRQNAMPVPLKILGDGPLLGEVQEMAMKLPQIEYLGQRPAPEVYAVMGGAKFMIFSSECYEPFALTIVESFSRGTPVLAADLESIAELVKDRQTGLRFAPGDADDLTAKISLLLGDEGNYQAMRLQCRCLYEERYTDKINRGFLVEIYQRAIASAHKQTDDMLPELAMPSKAML